MKGREEGVGCFIKFQKEMWRDLVLPEMEDKQNNMKVSQYVGDWWNIGPWWASYLGLKNIFPIPLAGRKCQFWCPRLSASVSSKPWLWCQQESHPVPSANLSVVTLEGQDSCFIYSLGELHLEVAKFNTSLLAFIPFPLSERLAYSVVCDSHGCLGSYLPCFRWLGSAPLG